MQEAYTNDMGSSHIHVQASDELGATFQRAAEAVGKSDRSGGDPTGSGGTVAGASRGIFAPGKEGITP
jgi:hypothetical protein